MAVRARDADTTARMRTMDYLTEAEIRAALTYEALIPAMEAVLAEFSAGLLVQPVRTSIPVPGGEGVLALMPAIVGDVMGVKVLTYNLANAARGIAPYFTSVHLFRTATGEPLAVLDGTALTEMRTAAVSAVAARALSAPGARVLAVLGSGVQARAHIAALARVRAIGEIRIWSRTRANAERLAREVGGGAMDAADAVRGAEIVVTATGASEPVLRGTWLAPGACVIAIGGYGRARRELDDDVMRGTLVVDSRAAALEESGDVIGSGAPIAAELGDVVAGRASLPAGHHVVFKSNGLAVEDIAAARLVVEARG